MRAVEIEDRVTVPTPEGVDLDLVVAGLGSRFMSSLVDTTLQLVVLVPCLLGAVAVGGNGGPAVAAAALLLVAVAMPAAFDAFGAGRTPGRRLTGLRLVMADGSTVALVPAAVRNVVRLVDFLPALYSVGALAVLATPRHQRLGDLAAGTLVVRAATARPGRGLVVPGSNRPDPVGTPELAPSTAGWDVTGVTGADESVVRAFLARRHGLDPAARTRVAGDLARRLEPVVVGPDRAGGDEAFLEHVLAVREARTR